MTMGLFDLMEAMEGSTEALGPGATILRGYAVPYQQALLSDLQHVTAQSPFRHMTTPGGFLMSVGMTNCGNLGWVTDRRGYRYDAIDPNNQMPWPAMPASFLSLAQSAATEAGFDDFVPDACLINRYEPGTRLSLHQDKNELDFGQPIVSVSLGIPAVFLFGGFERADKAVRVRLTHGDIAVWGGPDRLRYHGILPLKESHRPLLGGLRINLTFRKAG